MLNWQNLKECLKQNCCRDSSVNIKETLLRDLSPIIVSCKLSEDINVSTSLLSFNILFTGTDSYRGSF